MLRHRQLARFLAGGLFSLLVAATVSRAADVDVEDLRPGLATAHRAGDPPIEIVRLEPIVALNCKAGEAPHPRLAADGGSSEWTGYINILRAGNYRFSATLRGKLQVSVAGKEVLNAEAKDEKPAVVSGPELRLEAGAHPFVAKFTRLPGSARLELRWQGPQFPAEPLPHDALLHLPAKVPARLATDQQVERGRFLVEERSCAACHKPDASDKLAKTLGSRQGPDLSQVGSRVHPGWLVAWLQNPQSVRPGAAMPQVFTADEAGRVDAYAVARYLATLGGPLKDTAKPPNPNDLKTSVKLGKMLFTTAGCIACHEEKKAAKKAEQNAIYGAVSNFPLGALGSKTTHDKLAAYLSNPHAVDPSGRMPNMLLEGKEASDLARFLCEVKATDIAPDLPEPPSKEHLAAAFKRLMPGADDQTAFDKLKPEQQWLELGKRLVVEKNCTACHTVAPDKKPLVGKPAKASFADLKTKQATGCLVDDLAKRGPAPGFALSDADRKAVRLFLKDGTTGAGSPASAYAARLTIQRLNCLACHSRDGEGGLNTDLLDELRRYEKAENAEAVSPPPLTGAGHKLRTPWLKQVLTQKGRARPWMGLRMPQFGEANVGTLPEALAALEGTEPDDEIRKVALTAAKIEAGRKLVGKGGFGCISCHDIAGIPNTGTRGPDLAGMNQRVRFEWYGRWLSEAQRMQPGTRMPTVFPEGKSPLDTVLSGDAKSQAEAVWAYLSLGPGLPLPDGLEPPKGLILSVKDRPYVLRTFMPAPGDNLNGARFIAVGYPGEVSTAFDASTCRLAYAWSGNFLNAAPIWADRGGNKAKILGPTFWTSPVGCPWGVNDSNEPPDFAALAKNPAYGASMPNNKVFEGQKQLQFDGYSLDKDGQPTFRYRVEASESNPVAVKERPEPLRCSVAVGMGRHFALHVPAQRVVWLLAGETSAEPRVMDGKANPVTVDLKAGKLELPAADRLIVLPQEGDKIIVLGVAAAPEGSKWLLQKQAKTWQVILRLPALDKASDVKVDLNVWAPFRDEAELLKELVIKK